MQNKLITIITLLAAALLLVVIFQKPSSKQPHSTITDSGEPQQTERVLGQDPSVVLAAFPPGFPAEAGQSTGMKYLPANSTEQQHTLEYESVKTVASNQEIFSKYFTSPGFTILNEDVKSDSVFYYATKDGNDLSVRIWSEQGKVKVTASYLKR